MSANNNGTQKVFNNQGNGIVNGIANATIQNGSQICSSKGLNVAISNPQ